jgi:hypothetical protein
MQDKNAFGALDAVLMRRSAPPVPAGLSERIIAAAMRAEEAARMAPGRLPFYGRAWIFIREFSEEMNEMLAIPRPAYVLAGLMLLSVSAGVYSDYIATSFIPGVTTDEISTFMSIDDRFVASDFIKGGG